MDDNNLNNRKLYSRKISLVMMKVLALVIAFVAGTNHGAQAMAANEVGVVESQALSFSQEIGSGDLVSVIKEVADSVVEIKTQSLVMSQWPMNQGYVAEGAGSGVIITEQGHIVTNWHVAEDAQELTVGLNDGSEYPAQLLAYDEKTDLALLKIEADNLVSASLADSDEVQVGQQVFAIGNPLGQLGGTVTEGIISATSREITVDNQTMTLLQTSAAVNSGNSGGGLFDSKGNLVGIINAKSSGIGVEGLGFAIPSNEVAEITEQLLDYGYVSGRPQIGISLIEVQGQGGVEVYVHDTLLDNGLMAGDQIISVDGTTISSFEDLSDVVDAHSVGDTIEITVERGGNQLVLKVVLSDSQAPSEEVKKQDA